MYALYVCKDGSESPRRSRLLELVHSHLIANKPSICSSGCLILAQISRRRLSLPPLPTHVALRGVVVQGLSHTPLFAHVAYHSVAGYGFLRTSLLTHEVIKITTPCNIINIFHTPLRASIVMRKLTTPRNVTCADKSGNATPQRPPPRHATCTGKGGSESLRRDICASTRQPLEQKDDLLAIKCA